MNQPVNSYPWGADAFRAQRSCTVPSFLMWGAVLCSWCALMDRDTYTNVDIANYINQHLVANYVIIYGEGCFNSKRQARRTVDLCSKYRSKVHFVVIESRRSALARARKTGQAVLQEPTFLTSWFWMRMAKPSTTTPEKWIPSTLRTSSEAPLTIESAGFVTCGTYPIHYTMP